MWQLVILGVMVFGFLLLIATVDITVFILRAIKETIDDCIIFLTPKGGE